VHDLAVLDPDEGFEALIGRVEVRRRMLVMAHSDDDAEEQGDDGHPRFVTVARQQPKFGSGQALGEGRNVKLTAVITKYNCPGFSKRTSAHALVAHLSRNIHSRPPASPADAQSRMLRPPLP
jgi:hypothetical protein